LPQKGLELNVNVSLGPVLSRLCHRRALLNVLSSFVGSIELSFVWLAVIKRGSVRIEASFRITRSINLRVRFTETKV